MLEFLGFIALIAIIFGISFGTALTGLASFIFISISALIAFAIIIRLLFSKTCAILVLLSSVLAIVMGIIFVNGPYDSRYSVCDTIDDYSVFAYCREQADLEHEGTVNKGYGYLTAGSVFAFVSGAIILKIIDSDKKEPKKH